MAAPRTLPPVPQRTLVSPSDFDSNREALRLLLTGSTDPDSKASQHSRRASVLRQAYEHDPTAQNALLLLEEAVEAARAAVKHTSPRDRFYRPARLSDLSRLLQMLYEHYPVVPTTTTDQEAQGGTRASLAFEAISIAREAAELTPADPNSGSRAARYSQLARLHMQLRFKATTTKDLASLDDAIVAARIAVDATPPGYIHDAAARRGVLAHALETRFRQVHREGDLREAIQEVERAVAVTGGSGVPGSVHIPQGDHAGLVGHLALMCGRLWLLRRDAGDIRLLDDAVRYGSLAESLTPDSDLDKKAARLRNASMMLLRRYEAQRAPLRKRVDLDEAVRLAQDSLNRTVSLSDHQDRDKKLGSRRAHLARVQLARYEYLRDDEADLERAVENARRALTAPGTKWHRCAALTILGTAHQLLFRSRLDSKYLELAIDFAQDAVEEMPKPAAGMLSNFANALLLGFRRFRESPYLDAALLYAEKALEVSSGSQYNDSDRAARHSDLADIYGAKARKAADGDGSGVDGNKSVELLHMALHHALAALRLTQPSDPHRLRRLSIYGSAVAVFRQEVPEAGVPSLDRTIQEVEEMVGSGAGVITGGAIEGHDLGALRSNLGRMLEAQGQLSRARDVYEQVGMSAASLPMTRILALRKAGILYANEAKWSDALTMFREAISLLSRGQALQSLRLDDHEDTLSHLSGLASLSPVAALYAGESPREALVWAERGRGIIAKLAVNAPLQLIQDHRSGNGKGQNPTGSSIFGHVKQLFTATSRATWRSWRGLMPPLPALQEHEAPPSAPPVGGLLSDVETKLTDAELRKLAEPGPIISYTTSRYGSTNGNGAFIITAQHGVQFLPLPALHHIDVERRTRILHSIRNSARFRRRDNTALNEDILPWLWHTAVEPVLHQLDATLTLRTTRSSQDQDGQRLLPRVWWVSGGLLGSFPLHAAGTDWGPTSRDCAMRRVVSSYVPSVMGLWLARTVTADLPPPEVKPDDPDSKSNIKQLLFIAVPQPADGRMPELNVKAELKALEESADGVLDIEPLWNPDKRIVLDRLAGDDATVVHFACHGTSEQEQPSKSALLLREERLTAGELMTLYVGSGAGKQPGPELVDEAIHLASALFWFGFPNVVGPLWEVLDRAARQVTGDFYEHLAKSVFLFEAGGDGKGKRNKKGRELPPRAVADALHEAILARLQDSTARLDYASWASFVHVGI
ncbi:CHAT domain-containing protein [Dichotomopilus funicola]|uniref:CHAT domain-containing protein n=1 Tax=Dichotomopilus funicola TaxID=1934379 RepID=A0AAN6UWZ5_9PEZI|nr:CHAT domain-containing protein [Dichotomopilus funicola]